LNHNRCVKSSRSRPGFGSNQFSDGSNQLRPAERKSPAQSGGANRSPNVDVDAGTRPSDLNTRLSHAAALLDCYIAVADAPADRDVAVAVDAFFIAQWSHAVFPADPVRARWQRERRRTRYRDRNSENMSCSHPLASIVVAMGKRDMGKDVPKVPHAERWR
jgi:hypothetical protein